MLADSGVTSDHLETTKATYTAITILTALAWYNVLELNFLILNTFKRYGGLYFWAMLISSWGTLIHGLGFILKFFPTGTNVYLSVTIITIGWYCMVTGQSVVLYSRIHLVVQNPKVFRMVLAMIIVDAIIFHFPTTVMTSGANSNYENIFVRPYRIMEKIQMTAFSLQETIISGIYAHAALRLYGPKYKAGNPKPVVELLIVNIMIIAMDICLLGVEYAGLYTIEVVMKSLIYSIKLKLEFAVLTELKNYASDTIRSQTWVKSQQSSSTKRRKSSIPDLFDPPNTAAFENGIVKTMSADVTSFRNNEIRRASEANTDTRSYCSTIPMHAQRQRTENEATVWISETSSETEVGPYPTDQGSWNEPKSLQAGTQTLPTASLTSTTGLDLNVDYLRS